MNLKGPFRLRVLAGTRMAEAGGGSIINISSIGSLRPGPDELVYACAKAGLNALTIGLADAFGPRVRVNAILPGGGRRRPVLIHGAAGNTCYFALVAHPVKFRWVQV